ncbi:MAG: hypothetical protein EOO15_13570 [Chitinophagaceae bacterium]|nr:MAG: hypothetical protein EOO15_13570 [Chitinophagaceae bacterium]
MHNQNFRRAALATLLITGFFVAGWEGYWRSRGFVPTFNDDKSLWASVRRKASLRPDKATVFIGSSRIKFDLDIETWRRLSGEDAVQLSLVGTSPRLLLQDLAGDSSFRGKVVLDVTEVLFFSQNPAVRESAEEATKCYREQTPAERASAQVQFALESKLSFLEERRFSLSALLGDLEVPSRPGVFVVPPFPKTFEWTTRDRQTYMSPAFLASAHDVERQKAIWKKLILGDPTPPPKGAALQAIFDEVNRAIKAIEARGGRVVLVRTPSSGPMAAAEEKAYPRQRYWDELVKATGVPGLHYRDNIATSSFVCPEWSHLSPQDAIAYTKALTAQLQELQWFRRNTVRP